MRIIDDAAGVILELYARAPDGDVFLATAGHGMIGKPMPIDTGGFEIYGVVVSAEVTEDGKALKIGVKLDKMPPKLRRTLEN